MARKKQTRAWWRYLLTMEVLVFLIVVVAFIYFAYTAKKKKYAFYEEGIDVNDYKRLKKKKKGGGTSNAEIQVGKILREIFPDREFTKIRPQWLENPATGKCLEIDFYNADIITPLGRGLGIEYDGSQHSVYNPFFHKTPMHFTYQLKKDQYKDKICKEKGILLIRIPYFITMVSLKEFIIKKLKDGGVF